MNQSNDITTSRFEHDMKELESEITRFERNVVEEENEYAEANYQAIDNDIQAENKKIPYPDIDLYTTSPYIDEIEEIQIKKRINKPYWDRVYKLRGYYNCGTLYIGHVRYSGNDYFFTEIYGLESKSFDDIAFRLININDKKYAGIVSNWRFPDDEVTLSRNIRMQNKKVSEVDVVLDRSQDEYSEITDAYLRNALIRNKVKGALQSIITTIQRKQNDIRNLPSNASFIVQGCAGSGKTMVLLHRLSYLIFNHEINSSDYLFLVPSIEFKNYIGDISNEFGIVKNNVKPYLLY